VLRLSLRLSFNVCLSMLSSILPSALSDVLKPPCMGPPLTLTSLFTVTSVITMDCGEGTSRETPTKSILFQFCPCCGICLVQICQSHMLVSKIPSDVNESDLASADDISFSSESDSDVLFAVLEIHQTEI